MGICFWSCKISFSHTRWAQVQQMGFSWGSVTCVMCIWTEFFSQKSKQIEMQKMLFLVEPYNWVSFLTYSFQHCGPGLVMDCFSLEVIWVGLTVPRLGTTQLMLVFIFSRTLGRCMPSCQRLCAILMCWILSWALLVCSALKRSYNHTWPRWTFLYVCNNLVEFLESLTFHTS